ncbi:Glucan endo-1,3-beta-glucosidase 1 [Triticum urartu]|uniref:Glucan endo-1,3-beta-glucosidase 1 n=1 Tax=Triticum urartu TaxID=4572 RepID=M7Z840_TRIUA|nr:Glucan endo-1,3-beta-glucosidase 1 [Triticum urartu]
MLRERWQWQGCIFILVLLLLSNTSASGTSLEEKDNTILPSNSPSDFARILQSKQTRQARVCSGEDHRLLRSLANTGAEVMVTIPNSHLQHMAEFQEEARLWVAANVAPFLPATMITHILAGGDALSSVSPGDAAYSLVPAMLNLHAALVAAGLDGRGRVSTTLSPGQADCSAVQPGGACYKQNNVAALASYAYNDYYQKSASTGATCSFNGTATTTATDPSSGSCVFAGSTMAGGSTSNSSVPSASPPTSLGAPPSDNLTPPVSSSPPSDFGPPAADTAPPTSLGAPPSDDLTPPVGSSPPSDFGPPAADTAPPTSFDAPAGGFGPPSVFGSPPSTFGPPGSLNGSGSFGPSSTLEPYGVGCRHVTSLAVSTLLSAIVLALLCASPDLM